MPNRTHRPSRFVLVGAVALVLAFPAVCAAATNAQQQISQAAQLLRDGRLVEAKSVLAGIERETLTAPEQERAYDLMTAVQRRLRHADPLAVSLEKATLALRRSDLREVDRQALAVRRSEDANSDQKAAAADLLVRSMETKSQLKPLVEPALRLAFADFNAGRYADAKAELDSVYRSGVELTAQQHRELNRHRDRIAELERSRGETFEFSYVPLGMLQPGDVNHRDDPVQTGDDQPDEDSQTDQQEAEQDDASQPEAVEPAAEQAPSQEQLIQDAMRFDAQRILAEADNAFDAGRYNEALEKYGQIKGAYRSYMSDEDAQRAADRIAEIHVQLEQAGGNILNKEIEIRGVIRDQSRAEFDNFLAEARQAMESGDTEQARSLASEALVRLKEVRDLFSEDEFNQRSGEQGSLLQQIISEEESIRLREIQERESRLAREAQEQEKRRAKEKRKQINQDLDRIRALQLEQKYKQALQIVDHLLFTDPQNSAGLLLKDTLEDVIIYREWDKTQRDRTLSYAKEQNIIQRGMVLPRSLVEYPPDWPELSFQRGEALAFAESASDQRVLAQLDSKRIPASFANNSLEDVLEYVATVTNLSVDVDWESLKDVGIGRDTLVTLNLAKPTRAKAVLERVLAKVSPDRFSKASWAVNDGIVVVASDEALRRNTFIVIYDVRDLLFDIPSFTETPSLDLDSILNQRRGGSSGAIFEDVADDEGAQLKPDELRDNLVEIIETNIDFDGWRDNGGDTGAIQELNDNFIITNTAKNHRAISGLLRQLREIRSIQINVEARFLLVNQDFFEQLGFDLDVIFNAKNSQFRDAQEQQRIFGLLVTPSSGRSALLPSDLVTTFFPTNTQNRQGATQDFFVQQQPQQGQPPVIGPGPVPFVATAPTSTSIIPALQNSNILTKSLVTSAFAGEVLAGAPALQVAGTFLNDIQVDFLIDATQADRRSVTLTAPRLTFTNGHAANIFVTTQEAFVSDLNPIVGTNSVAFDPTINVINTGFTLALEGVVSSDRRYVTLTIQTALAERIKFAQGTVFAQTGGGGGGSASVPSAPVPGTFQLPVVQITSVSTGATIPDRGTLLIGGQRLSTEAEVETGVPVLSKIPVLNRFFTNRIESREDKTLFILIKPTILIQNEEEQKNFPGLLDSLQNRFQSGL